MLERAYKQLDSFSARVDAVVPVVLGVVVLVTFCSPMLQVAFRYLFT